MKPDHAVQRVLYGVGDRLCHSCRHRLACCNLFDRELLVMFGAQENTLALAREYVRPIKFAVPLFLFNQMLAAYLRNDKNPALATGGVLAGGIFMCSATTFLFLPATWRLRGRVGNRNRLRHLLCSDAVPFFYEKKYAASGQTLPAFTKLREICVNGLFYLFY